MVAAASEAGRAVTNGMSFYARDGVNCNGGLLAHRQGLGLHGHPGGIQHLKGVPGAVAQRQHRMPGAGAFSDGKLNTGTRDLRHRFILEELVSHGAPESILWDARPHVGTDYLRRVLAELRRELRDLGCDIRFGHRLTGVELEGGGVRGAEMGRGRR